MTKPLWTKTAGPPPRPATQLDELNVQRHLWQTCKSTEEIQAEALKASRRRVRR